MIKLEVGPEAAADIEQAAIWYESQRTNLGSDFLYEAESLASRIAESPLQFPIVYRDIRRALLKRFPFAVYFRLIDDKGVVIAVMDLRRSPGRWWQRA